MRQQILDQVVLPYVKWKQGTNVYDWNDLAVNLATNKHYAPYDIIIVDEAQDFSANQVRALLNHIKDEHSLTFVLDGAQRIYPRAFVWSDVGLTVGPTNSHRLSVNYRNTAEVAAFARSLLDGLDIGDDGTLPDLKASKKRGKRPVVLKGLYSAQISYIINDIKSNIDITKETIAFLYPAENWTSYLRNQLTEAGLPFIVVTRTDEWPEGSENIVLSTLHSAKGLEFDHVMIPGLSSDVTPHGVEEGDAQLEGLRRLLAMAIARARKSVILGYKPSEASSLIAFLDKSTYDEVAA